ncbi:hypothetical protein HDV02_002153 [Globomyces sp. JEL0801]|nr:hypothetical protein HDV02_002153 [Globomyces sp. JEL0801]
MNKPSSTPQNVNDAKRKGPIDFDHIDRTIALLEQTRGQKDFTPENLENKTNDAQITDSGSVTRIDATNNGKVLETGEVAPPMTFRWHANGSTPSNTTTTQKLSLSEIPKESFANASPSSVGLPTKNDKANGIITDSILPPVPYSKKSNI